MLHCTARLLVLPIAGNYAPDPSLMGPACPTPGRSQGSQAGLCADAWPWAVSMNEGGGTAGRKAKERLIRGV
jgi:hypothetical protein